MKQLLLLSLFLITFMSIKAQTKTASMELAEGSVRVSPNKDTLYLKDNDLGRQIRFVWESTGDSYHGPYPVIVMIPMPSTSTNEPIEVYPPKKKK